VSGYNSVLDFYEKRLKVPQHPQRRQGSIMDYFGILQRSFEITRRYRSLWLFGFLLALLGAGGNASNGFQLVFRGGEAFPAPPIGRTEIFFIAAIVGLIVLLLTILSIVVNYIAQAALIGMVGEIEGGTSPSVRHGFEIGWSRRALRLFGADLVVFVPVVLMAMLFIAVPIILLTTQADQQGATAAPLLFLCCMFLFIVLMIPVAIVLGVLQRFFYRRIVLADDRVFNGIRSAWQMIRANAGPVAVVWLIMFVIGLVWAVVNLVLVLGAVGLVSIPAAAVHALVRSWVLAILLVFPLALVALVALAAINALYTVFNSTVWTLTYLELSPPPPESLPPEGEVV